MSSAAPPSPGEAGVEESEVRQRDAVDRLSRRLFIRVVAKGEYVVVAGTSTFGSLPGDLSPASANVAINGADVQVELQLLPGIEVKIVPTGREIERPGLSLRIRDEHGAWVRDDIPPGGRSSQSGGSPFNVRLTPGRYTAEIHADHYVTGVAEFTPLLGA